MFSPTTNLRLCLVPFTNDYTNTMWFANVTSQTSFFTGRARKYFSAFNYIKKDNTIVVPEHIDNLYGLNYVMYQNSNYTDKWFYAFIDRMEWAGMAQTRLYVSTDCIQTWLFDIDFQQSYVDRCHSDTDAPGDNIVPEDFSGGAGNGYYEVGSIDMTPDTITVFATSTPTGVVNNGQLVNGMYTGSGRLVSYKTNAASGLSQTLNDYVKNGTANAVSRIQQTPAGHTSGFTFAKRPTSLKCIGRSGMETYTPTNKKLLSGAFLDCYVQMYGQEMNFSPEAINGDTVSVKVAVDETTGTVGAIVENYSNSHIASMAVTTVIPESTWAYNQYKNDYNLHATSNQMMKTRSGIMRAANASNADAAVAQSGVDMAGGVLGSVLGTIGNAVSGNIGGAVSSALSGVSGFLGNTQSMTTSNANKDVYRQGVDTISQELAAISENYNAPPAGSVAGSNLFIAANKTTLSYGFKVMPLDIVKRCDKYLSVYGYKQSQYMTINLHARSNWTYIKTKGLNAYGFFPDDDMQVIKRAFDRGIFFWANASYFGNFNRPNNIV